MENYDVVIIGAGPGGYVCGIRAAQLGKSVAIVEADKPGGVCLNWGCIPSKSLIHQAEIYNKLQEAESWGVKVDRSTFTYSKVHETSRKAAGTLVEGIKALLRKNNITYINDRGSLKSATEVQLEKARKTIGAKNIVIASGSRPREIPGFEFDEEKVLSSTGMLSIKELPRSIIIMGGGVIGIEFAYVMSSFGVKVQIIELLEHVLPTEDRDFSSMIAKSLKKKGVTISCSTRATTFAKTAGGVEVTVEKEGKQDVLKADLIMVSVGRSPNTTNMGLEKAGVRMNNGFIITGPYYETSLKNVFAIGDVVNETPLLAHVASKEGEIVAEYLAGKTTIGRVDVSAVPTVVYTEPQLAGFGMNEEQAKAEHRNYTTFSFPYRGAGKSIAISAYDGMVKLVCDKDSKEILGAQIFGHNATELIHELLLARQSELLPNDIAIMMHAHPTLSEAVMEAARGIEGWAVHV